MSEFPVDGYAKALGEAIQTLLLSQNAYSEGFRVLVVEKYLRDNCLMVRPVDIGVAIVGKPSIKELATVSNLLPECALVIEKEPEQEIFLKQMIQHPGLIQALQQVFEGEAFESGQVLTVKAELTARREAEKMRRERALKHLEMMCKRKEQAAS